MIMFSKVYMKCHSFLGCQMLQAVRLLSDVTVSSKGGTIISSTLKQLGFSEEESATLSKDTTLHKYSPVELKKTLDTLQMLGYGKKYISFYPILLKAESHIIIRRFKYLEESGFKRISLNCIKRFISISKTSVQSLKKNGVLDQNVDITKNILSYTHLPVHLYPSRTDDSQPLHEIQLEAVKCYLQWLLNATEEEIDNKIKIYIAYFKFKSIRLLQQSFHILQNDYGFSTNKILQHLYLLSLTPEQLLKKIERFQFINSKPFKEVAYQYPKILMRPDEAILEIQQILKEFNFDLKNAEQYPEIFSLGPETVRKRLKMFTTDPRYKYLIHNSRIFHSLIYFKRLSDRSVILNDCNWRCYSADLLAVGQTVFETRFRSKHDYYYGTDIIHFLKNNINLPPKEIHKLMSQHVLWNCVPIATISTTLEYLQEVGFSENQIINALPIILYPRCEVEKCLKELDGNPEVDCCRNPSTGKVRSDLVLQLVLYFIERPFHFTGNGVWELDPLHADQPQ